MMPKTSPDKPISLSKRSRKAETEQALQSLASSERAACARFPIGGNIEGSFLGFPIEIGCECSVRHGVTADFAYEKMLSAGICSKMHIEVDTLICDERCAQARAARCAKWRSWGVFCSVWSNIKPRVWFKIELICSPELSQEPGV